ncbi:MgtC/SapB family protein [Varunaivibrio sulfuroxidans]|uniref:Uncharacterized membrane protein (DUF4010 family) n=1 Tax=Varunaivibrio sulfuroxidans TaxID=1773489 RepID=A0A4R3J633_9PROT|nr:MgtC/SapB family protein [Varunaivibrio sulfuroxidans]TCS61298.1 uncharacterized membrane protein (DUF4010 family) [Varunaivibrio sulfuroxidans]WES31086.1 MgtC/SapB family protein [Varunaivibrio sulfuroxidans]
MELLANQETLGRLALALGIGLLVGIERGWHSRKASGGARAAGVRTFALSGLLGGFCGLLTMRYGAIVLGVSLAAFAVLLVFSYVNSSRLSQDFGLTSEVAALLVFILGVYAVLGNMALAAAGGVVTVALLDAKRYLHRWVRHLNKLELDSAIKLLLISVVVLPVVPNQGFGPGEVLNPYRMWWMVVLVAGLSFSGYIAMRIAGPRLGGVLTGFFGGLASSTALTVGAARIAHKNPQLIPMLNGAVAIASAVMYMRILVIVAFFNRALAFQLAPALGVMSLFCAIGTAFLLYKSRRRGAAAPIEIDNPCDISIAVKFALLLAVVALLAHYARIHFGNSGLYVLGAISGLVDVDAISLSLAEMTKTGLTENLAANAIFVATVVNTLVKAVITGFLAGPKMALPLLALLIVASTAGVVVLEIF